jgi:hypothetical protein
MNKDQLLTGFQFFFFLLIKHFSFSQTTDSSNSSVHFAGSVSRTNNYISIVLSYSLCKPAAQFIFSVGKNKFSFDPGIHFSLAVEVLVFCFLGQV